MVKPETAVAGALDRAHLELLEGLDKLETATRSDSEGALPELLACLNATQTHLRDHFRFEEQNGYPEAGRDRDPRLERTIHQLTEEHQGLAHSLAELIRAAGDAGSLEDRLRENIRDWVAHVRRHEERETDLVQDAFNLDIGASD